MRQKKILWDKYKELLQEQTNLIALGVPTFCLGVCVNYLFLNLHRCLFISLHSRDHLTRIYLAVDLTPLPWGKSTDTTRKTHLFTDKKCIQ